MILSLFFNFFKIGLFTFGGGYAMIPQIKETIVEKKKWLTDDELLEIITIAESTPGPIAINLATYIGNKKRGFLGSAFSTLGVVLPSFVIIFTISLFLDTFMSNEYVEYAFIGIKCAVAFLIIKAGIDLFKKIANKIIELITFITVFLVMVILNVFSISFSSIVFILAGGILGIFLYTLLGIGKRKNNNPR